MDAQHHDAAQTIRASLSARPADALVIVDFDETLWLRNSTEEYLDSLRPRFLAYLILLTLDALRPWAFLSRERRHVYRDWLRVLVCTVLMPWSLALWRRKARVIGPAYQNQELLDLLKEAGDGLGSQQTCIATLGTDAIVRPLLQEIAPHARLIAAGTLWSGHRIRSLGKKAWIEERLGAQAVRGAIVITDSESDADLLDACATPILVTWPAARYQPAFAQAYVPFLYTQRGKRPGERYMLYGVVLEDILLLCLAFAWLMPSPIMGALGLVFLHLSFWTIYELGYVENDINASAYEAKPKIWENSISYARRVKPAGAWLACVTLAAIGIGLLVTFNGPSLTFARFASNDVQLTALAGGAWLAYVVACRGVYWLYNRLDVRTRAHFYVVLQLCRTIGYGLLLTTNLTGMFILMALVFARWVKYLVYRDLGEKLREDQRFLMLSFYGLLLCAGLLASGLSLVTAQAMTALVWFGIYSRRRLAEFFRELQFVRR